MAVESRPGAYVLDNRHSAAAGHHRALAALLDPVTTNRVRQRRDPAALRRCLEVGAGGGSISRWLAARVRPGGEVVACDLRPDHLVGQPGVTVVAHDLESDTPLPEVVGTGFDLVVARLTLGHLPTRRTVLHRLAGLLAPGGLLLVEDWAPLRDAVVLAAPTRHAAELYQRYQHAVAGVFDAAGVDREWPRRIHLAMLEEGLTGVDTVVHAAFWAGGSPGARLVAAVAGQLRPRLLAAGLTAPELDRLAELLGDPRLLVHGHPLYSTAGSR